MAYPLLVLAVRRRRTPECGGELGRRGECCVVRVHASRQSRGDFLQQPAVAVRIGERGERGIAATLRIPAVDEAFRTTVKQCAHVSATIDELGTRRLDVGNDEIEILRRARHGRRDSLAEVDRAGRAWRRELYDPEIVTPGDIGVEPPTQAAVKALGAIDVRNGDDDDLELQVERLRFRG